ncbi:MAG: hypothetical protein JNK00_01330 [Flavipsychrobacter sp.]|nr:hypothetical protein [Flavipsychrobacter sp.]
MWLSESLWDNVFEVWDVLRISYVNTTFMLKTIQEQLVIGLPLENHNVIVPWNVTIDAIRNYGKPMVTMCSEQRVDAVWEDAQILGGLKLRLIANFWTTLFSGYELYSIYTYILEEEVVRIKQHLESYLGIAPKYKTPSEIEYYYRWRVGRCEIRLGQGDRFGVYYYISIRRRGWF